MLLAAAEMELRRNEHLGQVGTGNPVCHGQGHPAGLLHQRRRLRQRPKGLARRDEFGGASLELVHDQRHL